MASSVLSPTRLLLCPLLHSLSSSLMYQAPHAITWHVPFLPLGPQAQTSRLKLKVTTSVSLLHCSGGLANISPSTPASLHLYFYSNQVLVGSCSTSSTRTAAPGCRNRMQRMWFHTQLEAGSPKWPEPPDALRPFHLPPWGTEKRLPRKEAPAARGGGASDWKKPFGGI